MRDSSLFEWNFFSEVPPSSLSAAILMVSGRVWRIERVQWGHHQSFSCTSSPRRCWRRRRGNQMAIYCEREKNNRKWPRKKSKTVSSPIQAQHKTEHGKRILPLWWGTRCWDSVSPRKTNAHVYGATRQWIIIGAVGCTQGLQDPDTVVCVYVLGCFQVFGEEDHKFRL